MTDIAVWVIIVATALVFVGVVGKVVANHPTFITSFVAGAIFLLMGTVFGGVLAAVGWAFIRLVGG